MRAAYNLARALTTTSASLGQDRLEPKRVQIYPANKTSVRDGNAGRIDFRLMARKALKALVKICAAWIAGAGLANAHRAYFDTHGGWHHSWCAEKLPATIVRLQMSRVSNFAGLD